ncbi:unnamed protein product [Sphenostylis stenocarpa]|uniref:Uncharacterized protein n=1 Tax=Sphenostylis stenocarpa TaxID=92480 RepID=A0AA86RLP2_9FABA|nr:unnamed protein product [Sphenostylis stenocarpa]
MIPSGIMKPPRGKLSLPIINITNCVLVFVAILYAERLSFPCSKSIFKSNHVLHKSPNQSLVSRLLICCNYIPHLVLPSYVFIYHFDSNAIISHHIMIVLAGDKKADEEVVLMNASSWIDDKFDFDPEECNVANGKWVFNNSITPSTLT